MGCLKIVWHMYNLMVGLFDHKIRTQSHFVILTVWVNFSQHLRPRFPGQTTFGPRRPGSTRSQVWGLLQQMCPSSAICPVKVSLSRRPEPYLCALSKRFGPKYQPNVVKRYWLDSSCSLLLSSRPVCFLFLSGHRQGSTKSLGWRFCWFLNWI